MKDIYKVSDFDAKKAYSLHILLQKTFRPQIYIDDYWDYYINEYNLNEHWEDFLKKFNDDNLDYKTFYDEHVRTLIESSKILKPESDEYFISNCEQSLNNVVSNIPIIYMLNLEEGDYISVDVHSAFDEAIKHIGMFPTNYEDTYDIINSVTKYESLKNQKAIRTRLYECCFTFDDYRHLFRITSDIFLEKIYQSEPDKIKQLQLIGKTTGDNYIKKFNNDYSIFGEYECNGLKYSIDKIEIRNINMFGKTYKYLILKNGENKIKTIRIYYKEERLNPYLYPFALNLATGKELNEKDLAVGYEDQIFFHFDKSEII